MNLENIMISYLKNKYMSKGIPEEIREKINEEAKNWFHQRTSFFAGAEFGYGLATPSKEQGDVVKQQDEIIGRLTRLNEVLQDSENKRNEWLRQAKKQAGYHNNTSFDTVWEETLSKAAASKESGRELEELKKENERLRAELDKIKHPF